MFHSPDVSKVNSSRMEVSVADGLVRPACETPIRTFDLETLNPFGFRIICRECGQHLVFCEGIR